MNPSPESSDAKWNRLAARARTDGPPPLDVAPALRAAHTAAAALRTTAPRSWLDEFTTLFATPRRLAGCGSFAAVALLLAVWLSTDFWAQVEPWADLVGSALEDSL